MTPLPVHITFYSSNRWNSSIYFTPAMLDQLISFITRLFLFLLPVSFLPFPGNTGESDKQTLLLSFSLILVFLYAFKIVKDKHISYRKSPADFFILVLALAAAASALLFSPNKAAAFLEPYSAGTIISVVFLYFLLSQTVFLKTSIPSFLNSLTASSFLVALLTIAVAFGLPQNIAPVGPYFYTLTFLLIMFVFSLTRFVEETKTGNLIKRLLKPASFLSLGYLILILGGIGVSSFHIFTDAKPYFLPFPFGWAVMMETFKTIEHFFLGMGPANFPVAFTLGKPALVNASPLWNMIPSSSSSFILNLATEIGVIAAVSLLLITIQVFKLASHYDRNISKPYLLALLVSLPLQLLFPTNIVLLVITFVFMAAVLPKQEIVKVTIPARNLAPYALIVIGAFTLFSLYWQGRLFASDIFYRRAVSSLNSQQPFVDEKQDKDAQKKNEEIARGNTDLFRQAFDLSQQAINIYPYSEKNYLLSSSLNLNLAQSIVRSKPQDATESAKQVAAASQQAIAHTRQAINLNPMNSQNWGQLGSIYQSFIGVAQDAEQFALDAYSRQMNLDPNSPAPKLQLGNLMMMAGQYDQAHMLFTQAVNLKPDWNSAHYQLATLYAVTKRYKEAAGQLQQTLELTAPNSQDYQQIQSQLEEMKKLIPASPTGEPSSPDQGGPEAAASSQKDTTPPPKRK